MKEIDNEVLDELLIHDPETGLLTWKRRDVRWFTSSRICNTWNSRFSGKLAVNTDLRGYRVGLLLKRKYYAHVIGWAMYHKEWPQSPIDHINCIPSDNKISNLRLASMSQNQHNRMIQKNNTSGYKGVHFHSQSMKWRAAIWLKGKRISLGLHSTPEEAHEAYCKASEELHGEFSNTG